MNKRHWRTVILLAVLVAGIWGCGTKSVDTEPPPPPPPPPPLPAAPQNLSATPTGRASIALVWQATGGDPIRLERRSGGEPWIPLATVGAGARAYSDSNLAPGVYTYRACAISPAGQIACSNQAAATIGGDHRPPPPPPPAPPAAPKNLSATPAPHGSVQLAWTPGPGRPDGFEIERRTANGRWEQVARAARNETGYLDAVASDNTYSYRVRAFNPDGPSAWSNLATVTVRQPPPPPRQRPPLPPARLSAVTVSSAEGYAIERQIEGDRAWTQVAEVPAAGPTSFVDGRLSGSTTYVYRVLAFNTAGESPWSNVARATTRALPPPPPRATPPLAPAGLAATAVSNSEIKLTWTDNSTNAEGYLVARKASGSRAWTEIAELPVGPTSYRDAGLQEATSYTYRVLAFNRVGESPWSNEATATTRGSAPPPPPPRVPPAPRLSAQAPDPLHVNLSWQPVPGAQGYKVERLDPDEDAYVQIAQLPGDAAGYVDAAVEEESEYGYRVRAFSPAGVSGYSNEVLVLTPGIVGAPRAPQGVTAVPVPGGVKVAWQDASDDELGFRVWRRTVKEKKDKEGKWRVVGEVGPNTTSYIDGKAPPGSYQYQVRAWNQAGSGRSRKVKVSVGRGGPPPNPPGNPDPPGPPPGNPPGRGHDRDQDRD